MAGAAGGGRGGGDAKTAFDLATFFQLPLSGAHRSDGSGSCYLFRLDDERIADATSHGCAARFINHCCEPNCYSRVIACDGDKRIVICALRDLKRGEELTYNYKFAIETDPALKMCGGGERGGRSCARRQNPHRAPRNLLTPLAPRAAPATAARRLAGAR